MRPMKFSMMPFEFPFLLLLIVTRWFPWHSMACYCWHSEAYHSNE